MTAASVTSPWTGPGSNQRAVFGDIGQLAVAAGGAMLALLATGAAGAGLMDSGGSKLVTALAAAVVVAPVWWRMIVQAWYGGKDAASDQLIGLATAGSFLSGEYLVAMLVPAIVAAGHAIEEWAGPAATASQTEFSRLARFMATLVTDGTEQIVPVASIRIGDCIAVRPGEPMPVDGVVIHGESAIDESQLTGESLPRDVVPGDTVRAGCENLHGLVHVRATAVGKATAWRQIEAMLDSAATAKPGVLTQAERLAIWYLPCVAMACLATLGWTHQVDQMIAVLVACCPCGLVIAGPAAALASLLAAARRGILIRSSRYLERLATADTVVFDKTGTVTAGALAVTGVELPPGGSSTEFWRWAGLAAHGSRHPLARAIARQAATETPTAVWATAAATHREHAGSGISCRQGPHTCLLGKPAWLAASGTSVPHRPDHGGPIVAVALDGVWLGSLFLTDEPRPEAGQVVGELRALGFRRVILASGDRPGAVEPIAQALGCDAVFAEQMPDDKCHLVQQAQRAGHGVLVVGDGVNDAPALAAADTGMVLRGEYGTASSRSADLMLPDGDLRAVVFAVRLARRTRRVIAVNVAIATAGITATVALVLAGGVSPVASAVAHHAGSVLVLLNSSQLLLGGRKAQPERKDTPSRYASRRPHDRLCGSIDSSQGVHR